MASRVVYLGMAGRKVVNLTQKNAVVSTRNSAVFTGSGAVKPKPEQIRFPVVKVLCVAIPFLVAGATVSKNAAAFLEENDIFVPDDDDD